MRRRLASTMIITFSVAMLFVLGGCSNQQQPGMHEEESDRLTVGRPADWSVSIPVDRPWTAGFRPAPDSIDQMQISGDFGEYATAGQAVGTLIGQAQLKLADFTVVETRDVDIDGATSAQVVRYTITDNQKSQLFGEWIVAAHWPYPQSVAVSLLSSRYDRDLERQVLESMRMRARQT